MNVKLKQVEQKLLKIKRDLDRTYKTSVICMFVVCLLLFLFLFVIKYFHLRIAEYLLVVGSFLLGVYATLSGFAGGLSDELEIEVLSIFENDEEKE